MQSFPSLGLQRQLNSIRGDKDSSDFRFGQMTDYVESLEIVSELFALSDWDRKKESVILTAVECGSQRVYSKFFGRVKGLSCKRELVNIDLCSESAVSDKPLYGIGKTS